MIEFVHFSTNFECLEDFVEFLKNSGILTVKLI